MRVVGIDPGLDGAICGTIQRPDGTCQVCWCEDMPKIAIGKRDIVDVFRVYDMLVNFQPDTIVLEEVYPSAAQGPKQAFGFGGAYFACAAAALAAKEETLADVELLTPPKWKKKMEVPGRKTPENIRKTRAAATLIFGTDTWWSRQKDHDRAEAALLARCIYLLTQ